MDPYYETILSTTKRLKAILDSCDNLLSSGNQGISLLDVKNDSMLTYLINLISLTLKKVSGKSIEDVDSRENIVHMRVILEKILPIEEKLKYQIDKMVRMTIEGKSDVNDKSSYRANMKDLESSASEDENDVKTSENPHGEAASQKKGIYKPPKLAALPYNDEGKAEKQRKLLENAKKRALNSSVMQELKEEYLDIPLEISTGTTLRNTHTKYRKERESYEETYFTRLPLTKKEKHREKLLSSMTVGTLGNEIIRFEDMSVLEGQLPNKQKRKKSLPKKKNKNFKKRKTM